MGVCGQTNCERGFSVSLFQGDGRASPSSCNSGTSHSDQLEDLEVGLLVAELQHFREGGRQR